MHMRYVGDFKIITGKYYKDLGTAYDGLGNNPIYKVLFFAVHFGTDVEGVVCERIQPGGDLTPRFIPLACFAESLPNNSGYVTRFVRMWGIGD